MPTFNPPYDDLAQLHAAIWRHFESGADDGPPPWRLPVLATCGSDATGRPQPHQRTVVLRRVVPAECLFLAHTDCRSAKVRQLSEQDAVSWHFYDHEQAIQMVLHGTALIHHADDLARGEFDRTPETSLRAYLAPRPPGVTHFEPTPNLPDDLRGRIPTRAQVEAGFQNFAVIESRITSVDWLWLHRTGNQRARFIWQEGDWQGSWITP